MRYLCHEFERATQAELRVRVAYFSRHFFGLKVSIDENAVDTRLRQRNATKEAGLFFLIAVDQDDGIDPLTFFLSFLTSTPFEARRRLIR